MKYAVLGLFLITYVLIVVFPNKKPLITGISALVISAMLVISGIMEIYEPFLGIKFDVIFMLAGIMLTVGVFSQSNMPNLMADKLISSIPSSILALVLLSVLSGFISAFVDNVATVLMLAPIGMAVSKKLNTSPIPVLIAIAVSSNLQGAATLVGDTTSIMLADAVGMNFFDFFFFDGRFSIFWAVEIGAVLTIPVLVFVFRKEKQKLCYESEKVQITSIVPTILLICNLACLVVSSFIDFEITINGKSVTNGIVCLAFGLLSIVYYVGSKKAKLSTCLKDSFDYETVLFLIFLFIIIGSVEKVGIIKDLSEIFASLGNENLFLLYTVIVFGSVILSAFIDNIPFVATMLPIIAGLDLTVNGKPPVVLFFGLLIGATLGGNITPVGASANVVAIGILKKEGYNVKSSDFFKIGIPFTLVAVLSGYLFCWLIWGI